MLRLLGGLRRYVLGMVLGFLFVLAQVFSELKLPDLMSDIVDRGIVGGDVEFIARTGATMLLFAAAVLLFAMAVSLFASRTAMGFGRDLRLRVFEKVESFSLSEFDGFGASSLITRATNDVQQVQQFVQVLLTTASMAPFTFIGAAYMAYSKDRALALVIFATIPAIVAAVALVLKLTLPLLRSLQVKIDTVNRLVRESLTGIRVVRAYNRGPFEERRFALVNRDFADTSARIQRSLGLQMPVILAIVNVAAVAILWVGAHQVDAGATDVGDVMAVMQYSMQTLFAVMMFSVVFTLLPRAIVSANRIVEVLDRDVAILDPATPSVPPRTAGVDVRFEGVSFIHPGAEQPTLAGVSFTIPAGATVAVVGSTGAGKTSLMNLLLRFYDPTSGAILVDGVDIRSMSQADLRSRIGYVPQKTYLFSGTVADNIRFGAPEATDDDVVRAARIARAEEFVSALPDGFDSAVSQGGSNLSGGQRQRIAIARALVRRPSLYIFDDSFSALDYRTESEVRSALREETRGATVISITQRISSARDADLVVVLDAGQVVGVGTHAALSSTCGVYSEILDSQTSCEEVSEDGR